MAQEIERKFLVTGDFKSHAFRQLRITQGYLSSTPGRTVRIRIQGDRGFITVKGPGDVSGTSRFEWEKEIPVEEGRALLQLCEPGLIDKTRHIVRSGIHTFEVDEFHGDNDGLTVAEIELGTPDEAFEKPSWLGVEVTGDPRYYNAMLAKYPYRDWARPAPGTAPSLDGEAGGRRRVGAVVRGVERLDGDGRSGEDAVLRHEEFL